MTANTITIYTTRDLLHGACKAAAAEVTNRGIPAQLAAGIAFDYIRAEIWCDSGRIIVFPGLKATDRRVDTFCVQIICAEIEAEYAALAKSQMNETDFDTYTNQLQRYMADTVRTYSLILSPFQIHIIDGFTGQPL